jgi:hypothetical protein
MELVARCEDHCRAVTFCFYFQNFMQVQKTLVVTPAIAAGIVDKVLHWDWLRRADKCKPSACSSWTLQKAGYRNRNFKLRHYPILRFGKNKTAPDERRDSED